MTQEKLQDILGQIDDDMINQVEKLRNQKTNTTRKITSIFLVAAVLIILLVVTLSFAFQFGDQNQNGEGTEIGENISINQEANLSKFNELSKDKNTVITQEHISESEMASCVEPPYPESKYTFVVKVDKLKLRYFLGTVIDNSLCDVLELGDTVEVFDNLVDQYNNPQYDEYVEKLKNAEYVIVKFSELSNDDIPIIYAESIIIE